MKSRKKYIKLVAIMLTFLISCFTISGCSKSIDKLKEIEKRGKLTVYTNATFPPYEFIGNNGEIIGIDIHIAKEIAKELNVELEIKNTEFNSIITSIKVGKGDIAIAGITYDKDRADIVDFSNSYAESIQCLIVRDNSNIKYLDDLEGKTVGGEMGSIGSILMEDQIRSGRLKGKNSKLRVYNSSQDAMLNLTKNKIDAIVVDKLIADELVSLKDGYKAIELKDKDKNSYNGEFGVIVKKNNKDLLDKINNVIDRIKSDGSLDKIEKKYMEI